MGNRKQKQKQIEKYIKSKHEKKETESKKTTPKTPTVHFYMVLCVVVWKLSPMFSVGARCDHKCKDHSERTKETHEVKLIHFTRNGDWIVG